MCIFCPLITCEPESQIKQQACYYWLIWPKLLGFLSVCRCTEAGCPSSPACAAPTLSTFTHSTRWRSWQHPGLAAQGRAKICSWGWCQVCLPLCKTTTTNQSKLLKKCNWLTVLLTVKGRWTWSWLRPCGWSTHVWSCKGSSSETRTFGRPTTEGYLVCWLFNYC